MFAVVFKHDAKGKLNGVWYFENIEVTAHRVVGIAPNSLVMTAPVKKWNHDLILDLRLFYKESMSVAWYDKIYSRSSVLDLIELVAEEPKLTEFCDFLYRRL